MRCGDYESLEGQYDSSRVIRIPRSEMRGDCLVQGARHRKKINRDEREAAPCWVLKVEGHCPQGSPISTRNSARRSIPPGWKSGHWSDVGPRCPGFGGALRD